MLSNAEGAGAEEVVLWSNLLRVVGDDGIDRKALPSVVRLSKRAVRTMVDGLARHEWGAAIVSGGGDVAGRIVAARTVGGVRIELPLEYSHYPCGYGTADWRVTGGPGVDWREVKRDLGADTVTSLSLRPDVTSARRVHC